MNDLYLHWITEIIFLILITSTTNGSVPVLNTTNQPLFVCGGSETLDCRTSAGVASLAWVINGVREIACDVFSCPANTSTPEYLYISDNTKGIYQLVIKRLVLADNGTQYACEADGTSSNHITAIIRRAEDDLTPTKYEPAPGNVINKIFRVITGCITNVTAKNVQMKWIGRPVDGSTEILIAEGIKTKTNDTVCTTDPDCGSTKYIQMDTSLVVTNESDGDDKRVLCNIRLLIIDSSTGVNKTVDFSTKANIEQKKLPNSSPSLETTSPSHVTTPYSKINTSKSEDKLPNSSPSLGTTSSSHVTTTYNKIITSKSVSDDGSSKKKSIWIIIGSVSGGVVVIAIVVVIIVCYKKGPNNETKKKESSFNLKDRQQ